MPPRDDLAEFQVALLELLATDLPLDELRQRLCDDAAFAPFRDYVVQLEPRMLMVAVELVQKWGRRSGGAIVRHGME
jgi:hypothetical protein